MIVSHENGLIFIKTRKAASTSIEIALSAHAGPKDIISPISPTDESERQRLGFAGARNCELPLFAATLRDMARFAIKYRSLPKFYDHMSAYALRKAVGEPIWRSYYKFTFERNPFDKAVSLYYWNTRNQKYRPSLDEFILDADPCQLSNWHLYSLAGEPAVDFVGAYENLESDLRKVFYRLDLQYLHLPSAKSGLREAGHGYRDLMGAAARERIERVCRRELETFGYAW